jgi:RNA polymerase sigma-70 factor, ECF subfamily
MPTLRPSVRLSLSVASNHQATSDGDLARGLAVGEAWAVAETWHRFAPTVLAMAERALGSSAEADDLGQEVLACLFRKIGTLREPDKLRSFVFSIAIRTLKSELRRKRLSGWISFHPPEALVDLGSRTMDVESRDLLRKCHALLARLSPRDQLVFILRRMESMTLEEVAAAMELSLSTVKRSMAHASDRLSSLIDADPGLAGLLTQGRCRR